MDGVNEMNDIDEMDEIYDRSLAKSSGEDGKIKL